MEQITQHTQGKQYKMSSSLESVTPFSVQLWLKSPTHQKSESTFWGFLIAPESTGLGLSTLILNRLKELNIPFEDCRGQSYDNGANMKGQNKGVQARMLKRNPRALLCAKCSPHIISDGGRFSQRVSGCY